MRCLSVSALIVALAVPAGASTLTHSFDIRVTPTALFLSSIGTFHAQLAPAIDEDRISLFAKDTCSDWDGDGTVWCDVRDLPLDDLVGLNAAHGDFITSSIHLAPVSGRISFDGTGFVGCTGDLGRLITGCGMQGEIGIPESDLPGPMATRSSASIFGFDIRTSNGESFRETVGTSGFSRITDSSDFFTIRSMEFSVTMGYSLTSRVEFYLDDETPVHAPSAVPLPATLPLLLGAMAVAGGLGRRKRRMARA